MTLNKKIVALDDLAHIVAKLKEEGKVVAHCHGCFDLVHPGHIKHFEAAKEMADVLIVTITQDKHVNKGPGRPIFNENIRLDTLAALESIDYVALNKWPTAVETLQLLKPNLYVKGQDYKNAAEDLTGGIVDEKNAVEAHGGKLAFTEEIQFSSSKLINRHIDHKETEVEEYLEKIREQVDLDKLKARFDEIADYKVLVVGDIILDEYQFVNPMGKSSKSATITAKMLETEVYAGGVLAVANHIADFVKEVNLVTVCGVNKYENYHDFVKKQLHDNVRFNPVLSNERPTTLKRRYVDQVFKHKLFEVMEIEDAPLDADLKSQLFEKMNGTEDSYDLVVVADFGHGLIDQEVVEYLQEKDLYTAVNAQTNSANKGFNLITKYTDCDYFAIDREELQLAVHNRFADVAEAQQTVVAQTNAKIGAVTLGVKGCSIMRGDNHKSSIAPILSTEVVDTVGAGDAFLSITSLLAKQGASIEEIGFVGNAVGSMAVKILGNKSFIQKVPLLKYLKTLLS